MPGFELIGDEERRELQQVLDSGVLMRYGFDGARNGQWKCRELEQRLAARLGSRYAHVCSSGTAALSTALAACGVGAGDEIILPPFTFVADLETDPGDAAITEAIIALARGLNLQVVAEGVGTSGQLAFLEARDCHCFQGFLFSEAMAPGEFAEFAATHS